MEREKSQPVNKESGKGEEHEQDATGMDSRIKDEPVITHESDTIKNANASGLGAIGRNDQKHLDDQPDTTSN